MNKKYFYKNLILLQEKQLHKKSRIAKKILKKCQTDFFITYILRKRKNDNP